MSTPRIRIIDRILYRLLGNPGNPAAPSVPLSRREKAKPVREPMANMKIPVKTYDVGNSPRSLPISRERREELHRQSVLEHARHKADMESFDLTLNDGPGSGSMGLGVTDGWAKKAIAEDNAQRAREKRELEQSIERTLPNCSGVHAPIQTFRN